MVLRRGWCLYGASSLGPASVWRDNTHAVIQWERVCVEKKGKKKDKNFPQVIKISPSSFFSPLFYQGTPTTHVTNLVTSLKTGNRVKRDEQRP